MFTANVLLSARIGPGRVRPQAEACATYGTDAD
jgi:hypothetical protein